MNYTPLLYIGVAAPLVEAAHVWMVKMASNEDRQECLTKLRTFPRRDLNAYHLEFHDSDRSVFSFRTSVLVNEDCVRAAITAWIGTPPTRLTTHLEPISALDHRRTLAELRAALSGLPMPIVTRIGLTLQQFQRDLATHCPAMVLLDCHGTEEGCLVFEDGRARADAVSGDRLFPLIHPRPHVLFLAACHSQAVLRRAKEAAAWEASAIVHINADTPVEATACIAFETMFFSALLRGAKAGDAFNAAQQYVANDPDVGDFSVTRTDVPPSQKFCLGSHGQNVCLSVPASVSAASSQDISSESAPDVPYSKQLRRTSERFVGRQREMQQLIDVLLPTRVGTQRLGGERRVITLTKEGGIGKTTMALETIDWAYERGYFPGGIFELSCEQLTSDQELLSRLLSLLGVPPEAQKGDLLAFLSNAPLLTSSASVPALLVLDNLDDLCGQHVPAIVRRSTIHILETLLTSVASLRVLATCRWPLGLADHELPLEMPPMHEDEACEVFISHLDDLAHQLEARATSSQPTSPIRQLIQTSGRHPQSLCLLARQMRRKGLTLAALRDEAHDDLLAVLKDPLANDSEEDHLQKIAISYQSCSET